MANYIVQDTSLETVADAIRAKAGISEKLVFPDGWKAAVDNISVGSAPQTSFGSVVSGILPQVYRGANVPSAFTINTIYSHAVGSLQEG